MEFIKSWKFMAIIVGALCLVSLAGVIYGVVTHDQRDAGLMEGFEPWPPDEFPLRVCAHSYGIEPRAESDDHEHARYVIHEVNSRLGFDAMTLVGDLLRERRAPGVHDCHIILTYGVPSEITAAGDTGRERLTVVDDGGAARFRDGYCMASTTNVFGELRTLVVMHELGHCLGLDHDDFDSSIMRRVQSETPDRAFPPRITDHDRDLLRETYGR